MVLMFLPISASGAFGFHSCWASPPFPAHPSSQYWASPLIHTEDHSLHRWLLYTFGWGLGRDWKLDSKLRIQSTSVGSRGMIRDHWSHSLWASSGFTCFFPFVLWTEVLCRAQQGNLFPTVEGENPPEFLILNKPKFSSASCALCAGFL